MTQHGKQAMVVHVFRLAVGRGDDPYENVAVVGPFDDLAAAIAVLQEAGWRYRERSPADDPNEWGWELPTSALHVEFASLARTVPLG